LLLKFILIVKSLIEFKKWFIKENIKKEKLIRLNSIRNEGLIKDEQVVDYIYMTNDEIRVE